MLPLDDESLLSRAAAKPWTDAAAYWDEHRRAVAGLDAPLATLHLPALAWNAQDLLRRAQGSPIRVASKSLRVREAIDAVLALPGYRGVLAYTLAEALWLAADEAGRSGIRDVVVGYPSADRSALATLAADAELAARVTLMVDSIEQLDMVDAVLPPDRRAADIRVAIELDASYQAPLLGRIGVYRSPIRTAEQARAFAEAIVGRAGFALVGMMAYEAQIAGLGNRPAGRPVYGKLLRTLQRRSAEELRQRRGEAVAAVRAVAELEFVNGGGTGSLESTHDDESVTEIAAGSGLFGPHLFDHYAHFSPAPAAAFALPVVRRPDARTATLLGGGWIASGPAGNDRLPSLEWPPGLAFVPREAAGEVQSPVTGTAAAQLGIGELVWLRHTKAGELAEHVNGFHLVDDGAVVGKAASYRGEGKVFL